MFKMVQPFLLSAAFIAALPLHAGAQTHNAEPVSGSRIIKEVVPKAELPVNFRTKIKREHTPHVLAPAYKVVDSLQNAFSYYSTGQTPFAYEPSINRLVTIRRGAHTVEKDPLNNLNNIFIHRSDDWGQTWMEPIGPVDGTGASDPGPARYPSVSILMNGGEANYFYGFPIVGSGGSGWGNFAYGAVLDSDPGQPFTLTSSGITIDGTKFTWGSDSRMLVTKDNSTVLIVSRPNPPDGASTALNNHIAIRRIDVENLTIDEFVPPAWHTSLFPDPTQAGSVTVSIAGFDIDNTGTIYLGVFGRFNSNPEGSDAQTFAVSKSTDNGETWSDFQLMPTSVISDYVASRGFPTDSIRVSFNSDAFEFTTTGDGNFSFFTDVFDHRSDFTVPTYTDRMRDLVEIYNEDGQWGVRRVGELLMTRRIPFQLFANDPSDSSLDPDSLSDNQRNYELQVAKTVDGSKLLVKWIDYNSSLIFEGDLPGFGDNAAPDTVNTTDVFMSARAIGSNSWTDTPLNITDDAFPDKVTWIPPVVPNDLRNVPLFAIQSSPTRLETLNGQELIDELSIIGTTQYFVQANINADVAVGVEENMPEYTTLQLGNTYPNPIGAQGTIQFTLPASGNATLELYNVMGQKVLSLADGFTSAGTHYVNVNTSALPAGTYYYTLKWNGKSETRMMSVVH